MPIVCRLIALTFGLLSHHVDLSNPFIQSKIVLILSFNCLATNTKQDNFHFASSLYPVTSLEGLMLLLSSPPPLQIPLRGLAVASNQ